MTAPRPLPAWPAPVCGPTAGVPVPRALPVGGLGSARHVPFRRRAARSNRSNELKISVDESSDRALPYGRHNNLAQVGFGQTENREFSQEDRAGRAHTLGAAWRILPVGASRCLRLGASGSRPLCCSEIFPLSNRTVWKMKRILSLTSPLHCLALASALAGSCLMTGRAGAVETNLVLSLDGTSGYVSVPSAADLQTEEISLIRQVCVLTRARRRV
jgi:hypothetical protein